MPSTGHFLSVLLFFSLLLAPSLTVAERCHANEKKVLLQIKQAFHNVPLLNNTWIPDTDCCHDWHGVECDDTDHHVISLAFLNGELPGRIPAAIGDLPFLGTLIFHKLSKLSGPIPSTITKLSYLSFLEISWVNLTGPIPEFLGQLKNLTYLNLSYNKLTGPIPSSISDIPGLSYIRLDRNQLTGTIPASLVKLKANKPSLLLSNNKLSGQIPAVFREIDFGQIELSRNNLQGDISMLFGPNKTTNFMYFSRNLFKFNMSELPIHPTLTQLDLNHNMIYGGIPKEMINLELQYFNVSYNRLCGEIPQGGRLQSEFIDYTAYFHNRCLCGAPLNITCK